MTFVGLFVSRLEDFMERLKSIVLMIKSIFLTFIARYRKVDGDLIADKVTGELGSWRFIVTQSVILLFWISLNVYLMHDHFKAWDPYPFILLNLMLSFQAAFTGPIVLMSQNRQGKKDREAMMADLECDLRAEKDLQDIRDILIEIKNKL